MSTRVALPMLVGVKKKDVKNELHYAYLNLGNEYYIDVNDSAHARVYRTDPRPLRKELLRLGQKVNIWYRSDENFDFDEYIKQFLPDSAGADTLHIKTNFDYNEDF